jgi:uncharacterized protein (DUF924 family)
MQPRDILDFWFTELNARQWYKPDAAIDRDIERRFKPLYDDLSSAVPADWSSTAYNCLAAIIVLDQFPRNMFRGTPRAFATDPQALALSSHAIERKFDAGLDAAGKQFLYMPWQHAEDRAAQARSLELFAALGDAAMLNFAKRHHDIIARFGRFPHRNAILARSSTPDEIEFLREPGSSF